MMAQRACTASVMAVCEEEMKRTLTSLSSVATSWMRLCTPGGGGGGGGYHLKEHLKRSIMVQISVS